MNQTFDHEGNEMPPRRHHAHRIALEDALALIPMGQAASLLVNAIEATYGPEIGAAIRGVMASNG